MIFNKSNNGAQELRRVTSSYYANNDFSRIESTVMLVENEIASVLGQAVWEDLTTRYQNPSQPTEQGHERDADLVLMAQRAVGLMATMRYSRLNDLSHEDDGRKAKIDRANEARPFEWQLARDERHHLEEYYSSLNTLIALLEITDNQAWAESPMRLQTKSLLLPNSLTFSVTTGTNVTPWTYFSLVPFLTEAQHFVRRAWGAEFSGLLSWSEQSLSLSDSDNEEPLTELQTDALTAARRAEGLHALAIMAQRTELRTLPWGLMGAIATAAGGTTEQMATVDQVNAFVATTKKNASYWLNEMKLLRDRINDTDDGCRMLNMPENDPSNKYFLT